MIANTRGWGWVKEKKWNFGGFFSGQLNFAFSRKTELLMAKRRLICRDLVLKEEQIWAIYSLLEAKDSGKL